MSDSIKRPKNDFCSTVEEFRAVWLEHIVSLEQLKDLKGEPLTAIIPMWRKLELMPFIGAGRKVELSFAQLIWLRILDTLRTLRYPLADIRKIAEYLFIDAYNKDLARNNIDNIIKGLLKLKNLGTLSKSEEKRLNYLQWVRTQPGILLAFKLSINYLVELIDASLDSELEAALLIFEDGEVIEQLGDRYRSHRSSKITMGMIARPHIRLSITHYLREFIDEESLSVVYPKTFNEDEQTVLRELKKKHVEEIILRIAGGVIHNIESRSTERRSVEEREQIKRILGLKNYERIEINTVDGKEFTIKRTRKKINRKM